MVCSGLSADELDSSSLCVCRGFDGLYKLHARPAFITSSPVRPPVYLEEAGSTRLTRLVGNEKKKRERRRCLGVFSLGILHIN